MKKSASRITAGILTVLLLLSASVGYSEKEETDNIVSDAVLIEEAENDKAVAIEVANADDMDIAAENETLVLYIDRKTAEIAVKDKRTGTYWYSNPQGRLNDVTANDTYKSLLSSQVSLSYYNNSNQTFSFNSFEHSIQKQQFEVEKIKDGVKVIYTFSNYKRGEEDIPLFISKERFESIFLNNVTDPKDKELLETRFTFDKEKNVYKRYKLPVHAIKRMLDIMDRVGYTADDLELDNAENQGIETAATAQAKRNVDLGFMFNTAPKKPVIAYTIPVEYSLEKDNLIVNIPAKEIKYVKDFPLHSIKLLEYFGAADTSKEGYIFVPDGSGALIYLNNGKEKYPPVNISVYGQDYTIDPIQKSQFGKKVHMPVFGLKQGDNALVAIIEKGETLASIGADVSGRHHTYNSVSSEFIFFQRGNLILANGHSSQIVFQDKPYEGDYTVRYAFLNGNEANYVGMAKYYQSYLIEKDGLSRIKPAGNLPFYMEAVGAIEKNKSVWGFPVYALEPLTTFKQAQEIMQELQRGGVDNIKLRYSGWFNGGLRHSIPTKIKVDNKLGGAGEFSKLLKYASEKGIEVFPDVSFLNIYQNDRGFNLKRDVMRFISQDTAKVYEYNPATSARNTNNPYLSGIPFNYYLSPLRLDSVVGKFLGAYRKYSVNGLSLKDLGVNINSDSREGKMIDRQTSAGITVKQLQKIKEAVGNVMVEEGNALVLPHADHILNVTMEHSGFNIQDESIPFYQIVLHGYKEYAGEPVNLSEDYRRHVLKTIETGANLYYKWIYEDNSLLKDTAFSQLYSVDYKSWISDATALYGELNTVLGDVRDKTISDHRKLLDNVYQVTYENGKAIIINYNSDSVRIKDRLIEGMSYKVIRRDEDEKE